MAEKQHLAQQIGFQRPELEKFPQMILLAVASPCNLRCHGCPMTYLPSIRDTRSPEDAPELYLRPEYYKKFTDECVAHTTETFKPCIRISGYGEPLMHKNMVDMIAYSCEKEVPTSLITNGLLLTEKVAEGLIATRLESIEISVDAHEPELYAEMRVRGDLNVLIENVERLIKLRNERQPDKKTFLIGSIVKSPKNAEFIDEIVEFWKAKGFDHISVRKFLTWGIQELNDMRDELGEQEYMAGQAPCPYPYERIMVDPAGWIRQCPYDDQKLIPDFGHMSDTTIEEAWTSERFRKIRECNVDPFNTEQARTDAPLCADCEDRRNRSWTHNYMSIAADKTK